MRVVSRMVAGGVLLASVAGVAVAQGAAPAVTPPAAAVKVAYLNSNQVLEGAPGRAEALAQFEKETLPMRTQMQRMQDSLQGIIGEYQKAAPQLTPAQRAQRESVLGAKQQEFQQRAQEMQQAAQARQEELMAPIMEQVNKVIQDVRAEDGYAFIFDAGAQVPFIVSADKNLDITSRVIDRLKSLGAPKLPAPITLGAPPATAPTTARPAAGPVATPAGVTRPRP
ncbi:MAG: OmpH family outer membrane protein [Gemmatimonadaceae bacterium]|nr:OmpH family outer membrane protein [Gemmatimonadaceae bacterium]